jgi:hypothetical protein
MRLDVFLLLIPNLPTARVATTTFRAISLAAVAFKWLAPLAAQSPRNVLMIGRNKL